jgi:photosynthetic reaction center H subunit
MGTGAITQYVDVAQLVLYAFWIFFFGLIYWLQRESKREGYPMHTDRPGRSTVDGLLDLPAPKSFLLADGTTVYAPHDRDAVPADLSAEATGPYPGAPLEPIGNPLLAGVGPGSYTNRHDKAEIMTTGETVLVPLRRAPELSLSLKDIDPRGLPVLGTDGESGGRVIDVWVDRAEFLVRYLEIDIPNAAKGPHALVPLTFAKIGPSSVKVSAIKGHQFADVPRLKHPDQVTALEEDKVTAYFGAGTLYADPERAEPLF